MIENNHSEHPEKNSVYKVHEKYSHLKFNIYI